MNDLVIPNFLSEKFTFSLSFPGLPFETVLSIAGFVLNAYNVNTEITFPYPSTDSLETGNPEIDARYLAHFVEYKNIVEGLARDFEHISADIKAIPPTLMVIFNCENRMPLCT